MTKIEQIVTKNLKIFVSIVATVGALAAFGAVVLYCLNEVKSKCRLAETIVEKYEGPIFREFLMDGRSSLEVIIERAQSDLRGVLPNSTLAVHPILAKGFDSSEKLKCEFGFFEGKMEKVIGYVADQGVRVSIVIPDRIVLGTALVYLLAITLFYVGLFRIRLQLISDLNRKIMFPLVDLSRGVNIRKTEDLAFEIVEIGNNLADLHRQNSEALMKFHKANESVNHNNFVRKLVHDIRSPLMALKIGLEAKNAEGSSLMQKAIDQIEIMADELLDSTRTKKPSSVQKVELNVILEEVVKQKKMEFSHRKDVTISLATSEVQMQAPMIASEFHRLISNIVNNSIEAKRDACVEVNLSTKRENDRISLRIKDNGSGIPAQALGRIFSDFSSGKKMGNGLGLFNADVLLKSWGWTVTVNSQIGLGTEFVLEYADA